MNEEKIVAVFKNDMELCYDGVNPRKYEAGKVYEASHAHEKKMFQAFLADGRAGLPGKEDKSEKSAPAKEKISTPKESKKSKKSKK